MERSHSGLVRRFRKPMLPKGNREFKSHPLRRRLAEASALARQSPLSQITGNSGNFGETKSAKKRKREKDMYYVYLLTCADKKTYIGCTDDLKDRLSRHQKGFVPATEDRLPVKLASYFAFPNKYKAHEFEKYLKSGSGRAFTKRHLM